MTKKPLFYVQYKYKIKKNNFEVMSVTYNSQFKFKSIEIK